MLLTVDVMSINGSNALTAEDAMFMNLTAPMNNQVHQFDSTTEKVFCKNKRNAAFCSENI